MMRRMTGGRGKGWGDARKKVMQARIEHHLVYSAQVSVQI